MTLTAVQSVLSVFKDDINQNHQKIIKDMVLKNHHGFQIWVKNI